MVERHRELQVLGGFHAFPGGTVEEQDARLPLGPFADRDARSAAIRELFEETGIWLGDDPGDRARIDAARERLLRGEVDFPGLVAETGLRPDGNRLTESGRWVTPPSFPSPVEASFYLVRLDRPVAPARLSDELASAEWTAPREALNRWERGEWLVAPPTRHVLGAIAGAKDLVSAKEAVCAAAEADAARAMRIEVRRGLIVFPMRSETLPPATHTNAFFLGEGEMVLVDPGSPHRADREALVRLAEELVAEGRKVREIVISHHHSDHIGAVSHVRRALGVPVAAHSATARLLRDRIAVDRLIGDGEEIILDGPTRRVWKVIHTPGHSPGHIALFEKATATLLSSDLVVPGGSVLVNPPEGNMDHYLESLLKVRGLGARIMIGSHGGTIGDPVGAIDRTTAHRLERESQLLAALEDGPRTIDDLTAAVYDEIAAPLRPYAARNVLAHLLRLKRLGRVEGSDGAYRLRPKS